MVKIFGVPVHLDFSTKTVQKQERYEKLCELTNDNDNPVDMDLYTERVELFHELITDGVIDLDEECDYEEPGPSKKSFWQRLNGG